MAQALRVSAWMWAGAPGAAVLGAAAAAGAAVGVSPSWTWGTGAITDGMPVSPRPRNASTASVSIVVRQTVAMPSSAYAAARTGSLILATVLPTDSFSIA